MSISLKIHDAIIFATLKHQNQKRKGTEKFESHYFCPEYTCCRERTENHIYDTALQLAFNSTKSGSVILHFVSSIDDLSIRVSIFEI